MRFQQCLFCGIMESINGRGRETVILASFRASSWQLDLIATLLNSGGILSEYHKIRDIKSWTFGV